MFLWHFGSMLAYWTEEGWRPGIGDPSFMGWFTVCAYFAGAVLCWRAARSAGGAASSPFRENVFWLILAVFLTGLGVNKQLDLQTWFTITAREFALERGWYESRRVYQLWFITAIGTFGVSALLGWAWLVRHRLRSHWLPLTGAVFLGCFILIRAASFHHVDRMLGFELTGLRMNWLLELGGIFLIAGGAWVSRRGNGKASGRRNQSFIWVTAPAGQQRPGDGEDR